MARKIRVSVIKLSGAVLAGLVAAGASGLGSAPTANATCASFFGIGNSAECTSSLTSIAIALGPGATAKAAGFFDVAIANGLGNAAGQTTVATANGNFNFAFAGGPKSTTTTNSNFTIGIAQGAVVGVIAGGVDGTDFFNTGVILGGQGSDGPGGTAPYFVLVGGGVGNMAVSLGGGWGSGALGAGLEAIGSLNTVVNVGGSGNLVTAGVLGLFGNPTVPSQLGLAFNLFGTDNKVQSFGVGSAAVNVGASSAVVGALGTFNYASNFGGTGNIVTAGDYFGGTNTFANAAFNLFGGGSNTVSSGPGPLAIAGSIGQTGANVSRATPGMTVNGIALPAGAARAKPVSASTAATHKSSAAGIGGTKRSARE